MELRHVQEALLLEQGDELDVLGTRASGFLGPLYCTF